MKRLALVTALIFQLPQNSLAQGSCSGAAPNDFRIELIRAGTDEVIDKGVKVKRVYGDIGLNNKNIGRFYENPEKMIAPGTYKGALRYQSNHNFVLSSCGTASISGDFLIEVAGVKDASGKGRSNILLHPGMLPSHSEGCVLFGARKRDADGKLMPLDADYPLVKIRKEFYGTDNPVSCPNKTITVVVSQP